MLERERWSRVGPLDIPYNQSGLPIDVDLSTSAAETAAMSLYQYELVKHDKGLLYVKGCVEGTAGCRTQPPLEEGATLSDAALQKARQTTLRSNLWAHALPTGGGYAALDIGSAEATVKRTCLGADGSGSYYLTVYADAELSGDGRLSEGPDGEWPVFERKGDAAPGVDTTGWRNRITGDSGCWCCDAGVCGACYDVVGPCVGLHMPPANRRRVLGYRMHVTHIGFARGQIDGNADHMGCVSYGQWRHYEVHSTGVGDGRLTAFITAPVEGMYAALNRRPTATDYDVVARPPNSVLALSGCDATGYVWHISVHLGELADGLEETRFTLQLRSRSGEPNTAAGGVNTGSVCCGGFEYWRVPHIPADKALSVHVDVLDGSLHGVFTQFDTCPLYVPGDSYRSCGGLCDVTWFTWWDVITGKRTALTEGTHTVSMGETVSETDKRRAGTWVVGFKALPGSEATYNFSLSLVSPKPPPVKPYCSGHARFCAPETQRLRPDEPVTTAADVRALPLVWRPSVESSAPRSRRGATAGPLLAAAAALAGTALLLRQRRVS